MDPTCGKMVENISANGHRMICKDSASTSIQMECDTMVSISLIKKKDMEFITGLTAADMKAGGTKASNMV